MRSVMFQSESHRKFMENLLLFKYRYYNPVREDMSGTDVILIFPSTFLVILMEGAKIQLFGSL